MLITKLTPDFSFTQDRLDQLKQVVPEAFADGKINWDVLREDDNDHVILRLVRETKGLEDVDQLRFSNEGRKVLAAQKHFNTINIDYRMITDTNPFWCRPKS